MTNEAIIEYQFSDVRVGPAMRGGFCGKRVDGKDLRDVYGRPVVFGDCTFPKDHSGPCAMVEYLSIQYGDSEA